MLYSFVHFVALLLSLLPTVMGRFVEVERELNWTHSVGIDTQYDFFYFGLMSTIVKQVFRFPLAGEAE